MKMLKQNKRLFEKVSRNNKLRTLLKNDVDAIIGLINLSNNNINNNIEVNDRVDTSVETNDSFDISYSTSAFPTDDALSDALTDDHDSVWNVQLDSKPLSLLKLLIP